MPTDTATIDQLSAEFAQGGASATLTKAATILREHKKYHELFEVLKMQLRQRLGLPLTGGELADQLSEPTRLALEEGLVDACRTVGTLFLEQGSVREGWMYLRPVGDKQLAQSLLAKIEADEENTEDLIDVLLHEGIDLGRGFELVIESYGTCSSITTYDQAVARRPADEQVPAARKLLERVHRDLIASVKTDIARQEGSQPKEATLAALLADRDWLMQDGTYHLDTTHLASTVRISRVFKDKADIQKALDLTEYGLRLAEQFQYQGDEPFTATYPHHKLYFNALLGNDIEPALKHFREKAELLDVQFHGTVAIDVYVDLLRRIGRPAEALKAALTMSPAAGQPAGLSLSLLQLAEEAGDFDSLLAYCRDRGDLLGYTAALVKSGK